jgi:hypothetical protein
MRLRSLPALLLVTTLAIGTSTILRAESTTYPQFHFGHTPVPPAEELHPFTAIQPQAVGAEQSVDVLVLVHPDAVYDDGENVYAGASLASLFVRRLNESTQRSVRLQGSYFKLVRVATIDYPNTNTAYQTLSDLTYANAQFSQVPSLAAKPGADIVVYFAAPEARWAGMSWQYTADAYNRDLRFTEFSYSVVSAFRGDMDNFAGLHEAGHIMGLPRP